MCTDYNRCILDWMSICRKADRMKVAFIDPIPWDYNVATVDQRPLGGRPVSGVLSGVRTGPSRPSGSIFLSCLTLGNCLHRRMHPLPFSCRRSGRQLRADVVIAIFSNDTVLGLHRQLGNIPLVLWIPHAEDDPALGDLRKQSLDSVADAFVLVSDWQAQQFRNTYAMPEKKTVVLRNAVAPAFENSLCTETSIFEQKGSAPSLLLHPHRFVGCRRFCPFFPAVREQISGVRLQVYSSMQVYQMPNAQEQLQFGRLYGYARRMAGVEYKGAISQPAFAGAFRHVSLLAYPSIFTETSCIAVMEAMAAGCQIVTSDLGALPETISGFATLVPMQAKTFLKEFIRAIVEQLQRRRTDIVDKRLREQIGWVRRHYSWASRARMGNIFAPTNPRRPFVSNPKSRRCRS